jgi:hypothetical protein
VRPSLGPVGSACVATLIRHRRPQKLWLVQVAVIVVYTDINHRKVAGKCLDAYPYGTYRQKTCSLLAAIWLLYNLERADGAYVIVKMGAHRVVLRFCSATGLGSA